MTKIITALLELSLPPTMEAPALARATISEWLAQWPGDQRFDDTVVLLVSELVSNSIRHARIDADQPLRLHGEMRGETLRVELWDAGTQGVVAPRPPALQGDKGGFGLDLVARLSVDWGVERDARGTTVWMELQPTADQSA